MPYIYPTPGPYAQGADPGNISGTALPWWAVVLWSVIGTVLFLLMVVAWCVMFGDQCYCVPSCSSGDSEHDDTDQLVPRRFSKRRFWVSRRGRYQPAVVVDDENSMDELMMEPMHPVQTGMSPGKPCRANSNNQMDFIDSE